SFGVREALDQFGAPFGPLLVAVVLSARVACYVISALRVFSTIDRFQPQSCFALLASLRPSRSSFRLVSNWRLGGTSFLTRSDQRYIDYEAQRISTLGMPSRQP